MSWPTQRLRPVDQNDNDVGFVKGRQVLSTGIRSSEQRPANSHEQFAAVFGYSSSEHSRGRLGTDHSEHAVSNDSSPRSAKGRKSPTRQSMNMSSAEDMQKMLGYRTKRKGEHDLTPAQQRAIQFRSAINKSTVNLQPDLSPASILESAAAYALPPSAPPPSLSPAILDGLKPLAQPLVSDGTLLGTMVLPKDLKPFSSSTRLPHQTTNGGPGSESSTGSGYFLMQPVDVSMADAYNYSVPADIRTGEDAVCLFSSSGAKSGLIIYCNLNPACPGGEYNPYDLVVVERGRVDPRHHYVMTQSGVTQMLGGHAQQLQPFHSWQRDRNLFTVLRKLVFFKHNEVFQAFTQWRDAVRVLKFRARQRVLTQQLLVLSPTFHRALLNVRRMTLAVSCDTNGTWRKTPEDHWIELEAELVAPSATAPPRQNPSMFVASITPSLSSSQQPSLLPAQLSSLPLLPQSTPPPLQPPAPQQQQPLRLVANSSSGFAPVIAEAAAATTASTAAACASSVTTGSSRGQSHTGLVNTGLVAVEPSASGSTNSVSDGLEVMPLMPLPPERLPESGLPYQLGYVGTLQDQFTLSDFKRLREEQRNLVASALQDMVLYVRSQVQAVGQAVQANLAAAQAAVAKPTRQEARQKRFEAPGSQAWKAKSLALARLDAEQRQRNLQDAVHATHLLLRFITLADCLMLGQLMELARLAVLLCVRQLEIPRKTGLYLVVGTVEDPMAVAAAATVRPMGLPTWGRAVTMATVSFAASTGRRRSNVNPLAASTSQWSYAGDGTTPRLRPSEGIEDDEPEGVPAPAPQFIITPASDELASAVSNLPREILHVVVVSAAPLVSYPEVRQMLAEIGAKGIPVPPAMLVGRPAGEGSGSVAARAASSFNAEVLRGTVDVRGMMTRLQLSVLTDYNTVMHHPAMFPFRGHEVLWGMVSRFTTDAYKSAGMTPEQLHADLTSTSTWLAEMTSARTSVIVGLVAVDMSALQRAALPVIQKAHSGIISLLGGLLVSQSISLNDRLVEYTNNLVSRPSQLPDFVQYVEVIWPHLDPVSSTRQSISSDLEHMTRLHIMYLESGALGTVSGQSGTPTMYHPLYWVATPNMDDDDEENPDASKPPSKRRVRTTWEALQTSVARYLDEARAAADYFQAAAGMMVTHLKTSLIESGNALHALLLKLRTGTSTNAACDAAEVSTHLDGLAGGLRMLAAAVEQHSSWARLLSHPSTNSLVASLETQLAAARVVLAARRSLWDALAGWRRFLDRLYGVPCTDPTRESLTAELEEQVVCIRQHATKITSLHTDDDLTSTRTVTSAEQKLGAHLSLLVKSWQEILPTAQVLVHPAVKPRHLRTLQGWLAAHQTALVAAAAAATSIAGGGSGPLGSELGNVPLRMMQNPYAALPTHVRQDDAALALEAGKTSLAQLVTSASESAATQALVMRISQVAQGEAQLTAWLRSIQDRMQAIPLSYTHTRTWNSFTPTNLPEVLASLAALVAELGGVQNSSYYCGVLREFERVEQLLGGVQRSLQDASACLDMWTYMNQLLHNPLVAEACPDAVTSLELLGTAWRKLNMAAMEQPTLTAAAVALQDCRVLMAGFDAMRRSCATTMLPALREAYPRMWMVGDEVVMLALSVGGQVEALPSALLEGLFGGARALHIQLHHTIEDTAPQPPEVIAVVGANGEVCSLCQPLQAPPLPTIATAGGNPPPPPLRLEVWLPALEAELRSSLAAHTRDCLAACGYMSPDVWVSSFPSQSVMLVDAIVWTQTVTSTLERTATGERAALRNLLDQSVLRLETMARQLRGAMVAVSTASNPQPSTPGGHVLSLSQKQGQQQMQNVHMHGGRQVEDLPGRAARAALTAVGAATAAARTEGSGDLSDDDEVVEPPLAVAASPAGSGSAWMSSNVSPLPAGPPRMPKFLVCPTTATAATAMAAAAAAAAVPALDAAGVPVGSGPYLALDATELIGPASTAAYLRPRRSSVFISTGMLETDNTPNPELLSRQTIRGIERLLTAGICHRHVLEDLIGAEVLGPDSFDWQRNVRHYWDSERGSIDVAFGTQRHEYGWEYDGTAQDVVELVLPMCVPSLLAAVSALQASPVVSLVRGDGACSSVSAVRALTSLLGRLHMHVVLDPSTSTASMARSLATAVKINAWLTVEGAELLGLATLAALSELLQGLLAAAASRQAEIQIAGESIPSPWAMVGGGGNNSGVVSGLVGSQSRNARPTSGGASVGGQDAASTEQRRISRDTAATAATASVNANANATEPISPTPGVFLVMPLAAYLPISHDAPVPFGDASGAAAAATVFLTEASHVRGPFPHELCEVARRAGRAVTLHSVDLAVALEAGLRCAGLRDAAEAARAAACWFRLAGVQVTSPPQLSLDAVTVRTLLMYIHAEWLTGNATATATVATLNVNGSGAMTATTVSTPAAAVAVAASAGNARIGGSALDALDAAMRAMVMPAADPEDVGMLMRLFDQVIGFAQRTPAPPEPVAGQSTLLGPTVRGSGSGGASTSGSLVGSVQLVVPVFNIREALKAVIATAQAVMGAAGPGHPLDGSAPPHQQLSANHVPGLRGNIVGLGGSNVPLSPYRRVRSGAVAVPTATAAAAAAAAAQSAAAAATAAASESTLPPPQPAWKPHVAPLAYTNAPLLISAVASIYDALLSHRVVLVAGQPGSGKSTAWKALIAATHGVEALTDPDDVLHVYSETLPTPRLQYCAGDAGPSKADTLGAVSPDGRVPQDWLLRRLEGLHHWALRRRGEGANVQSGSAAVVGSSPKWVIFDGPLGTARADRLASLLLSSRSVVLGSGGAVLELASGLQCLWETSDLSTASPAFLAAVPVVHVGSGSGNMGVWDAEAVLLAGLWSVIKQQAMTSLLAPRFIRQMAALLGGCVAGCESVMNRLREKERGNHGAPYGLTMLSELIRVFIEVVRSLDVIADASWAEEPTDLELALARCAVFSAYWVLGGQVLGPGQRAEVENAIRDAAVAADLTTALPLGGSLAAWLVAPKRGVWVPWAATLRSLPADRPSIVGAVQLAPLSRRGSCDGDSGADSSEVAFHYFRDVRGAAGCLGLFVSSPATQALQYAMQLVIQGGGHPIVVGSLGSGRRTLVHHLLATVQMQQMRTQVMVVPACASTSALALQAAVMWHLAPGAGGSLRPTPGHRLVVVVEDLNAAVVGRHFCGGHRVGELTAAAQVAGGGDAAAAAVGAAAAAAAAGYEVEVTSAAMEWLRHVLDEYAIRDPVSGLRLTLRGTSFAATSTPYGFMCGAEQVGGRLRRHLTQIHIDAAARCAGDNMTNGSDKSQTISLTTVFNRPAVVLALAQHTVSHLAHCGVPETIMLPQPAVAAVFGATLESAVRSVSALSLAGVTPALWHFDTAAVSKIVLRLCGAVSAANGNSWTKAAPSPSPTAVTHGSAHWGLRHVLQRLAFEVGRSVMGHLSDSASREALAKLLLQTMGRHLGALASGRLDTAVAAAREVLNSLPPPPPAAALAQQHLHVATGTAVITASPPVGSEYRTANSPAPSAASPAQRPKSVEGDPLEVLAAWADFCGRGAADLRSLRVGLAGRIPPREIDLLLAALVGSLPVYDDPSEAVADQAPFWPVDGGSALRCGSSGGPVVMATAPWAAGDLHGFDPGAAGWVVRRPLGHPALLRLVRAMLAAQIRGAFGERFGGNRATTGAGRSATAASVDDLRAATTASSLASVKAAGAAARGEGSATNAAVAAAAATVTLGADEAMVLPRCNMGPLSLALLEDASGQWGYAEMVRPVAAALYAGYFIGGNVVLVGNNVTMLEHTAGMAALATGANVMRISRPPVHRSNGGMMSAPLEEYALRQLLLQQLIQILQPTVPLSSGGGIGGGGIQYYSPQMAAAAGGFAVPGVPYVPAGEADAVELVPPSWDCNGGGGDTLAAIASSGTSEVITVASSKAIAGVVTAAGGMVPEAELGPLGTSSLYIMLLTDGMLQDDPTLELLQSLLVRPASLGPLCRDLHDSAGLPLLKGLEPILLDSDLGSLIGSAAAAGAAGGGASSTGTGTGTSQAAPSQDGGGGIDAASADTGGSGNRNMTKNMLSRMVAANYRHRTAAVGIITAPVSNGVGGLTGTGSAVVEPMERAESSPLALSPNQTSSGYFPDGDEAVAAVAFAHPQRVHLTSQQHPSTSLSTAAVAQQQQQQQPATQQVSTIPPMKSEGDSSSYGAARVQELRQAEVARAELEVLCGCRMVSGVRFLLTASTATWTRLRSRYPALATALTPMTAVDPTVEDQQASCTEALGNIAAHVADHSVSQHEPIAPTALPHGAEGLSLDNPAGPKLSPGGSSKPSRRFGRSPTRSPSPESRGLKRNITLTERMASLVPPRPKTAAEEREAARLRAREDSELLQRVGEVAVAIHAQAQELYRQMGLLDGGASLPLSKVTDLIHMLSLVHSSHRKVLQARQATLHVCLSKLATSESELKTCLDSMTSLNNFMDASKQDLVTIRSQISHLESFIAETSEELQDQEGKVETTQAVMQHVHAEVAVEMAAARQRYQRAIEEVDGLSEADLAEIRSYKEPHVLIRLVVMALCVLFEWPTDWRNAQRLLGEQNPKLLDRLHDFDVRMVSPVQVAKLSRLLQEPDFNVVSVEQVSVAAKSLAWWVISVSSLLRTQKECDLRLARLGEGEERMQNTCTYIRKLRGELKAGQAELTRQQQQLAVLEHQLGEASARLRDNEMQRVNITRLSGLVQGLIPRWQKGLASVEARLPALVGDALLAVSAVVYLGPLDGRERAAVLGLWRDVLQQRGVPVSPPPYDFTAFVADRFEQMTCMLPAELLANTQPLWRDNLAHMAMTSRPPLLLDPAREGANLVKAMFGKSSRVFYMLTEEGLLDKMASAVRAGRAVVVDMYGTSTEASLLARLCKRYEVVMRRTFANLATEPHHLYLRLRSVGGGAAATATPPLPPAFYQYTTPLSFTLRGEELRGSLRRTLLAALAGERETLARQLATRLWQQRAKLDVTHEDIAFTIAHTKGLIWSHPGLVDSTVSKANQAAAGEAEVPAMEAALAEVSAAVEQWRPLVDGVMRVHGVLEDLARCTSARFPALPASVLMSMFRSALRRGVAETPGALALVRDLQGPTAPPEMSVGEARRRGAKALVSALLSRGPSCAASRLVSRATSRWDLDVSPQMSYDGGGGSDGGGGANGGGNGSGGGGGLVRQSECAEAMQNSSRETKGATAVGHVSMTRYDSLGASTITGLPLGHNRSIGRGRPDSADSEWTSWTDGGRGGTINAAASHVAAMAAAEQLLQATAAAPAAKCRMEDLAAAMLSCVWSLVGAALGRAEGLVFRLLLAISEQQATGEVTVDDLQLALYVLGRGTPSAQEAAAPHGASASVETVLQSGVRSPSSGPPRKSSTSQPQQWFGKPQKYPSKESNSAAASTDASAEYGADVDRGGGNDAAVAASASLPGTASSFMDLTAQAAIKQVLAGATVSPSGPPETRGSVAHPTAAPVTMSSLSWPSDAALADLRWLAACACGADLNGLAVAVAAAPRVWYTLLTADAMPRGTRPDLRVTLSQSALAQLPDRWRELLLNKPIYQVILTAVLAPEALAAAINNYASTVLGLSATSTYLTPGERLLAVLMSSPPSAPVILATAPGEDPVAVVHQAQALCANHLFPLEPNHDSNWAAVDVVIRHFQPDEPPTAGREVRLALAKASRAGAWLLLPTAHASPATLAMLLEQINARDFMMRHTHTTFRLLLAMPADAVPRLHPNVLAQCVRVAVQPPGSVRAAAAAAMQALAQPSARRFAPVFGGKGGSDIELANHVLATALLVAGLNHAVENAVLPPTAVPLTRWDFLAAAGVVRQALMDGRITDDVSSLDYLRLHERLAAEVLMPALPAARLGRFAGWALQRLLVPGVFTLSYPVYGLVDPDAEPGNEVAASMPLNVRLPGMLDYLSSLYGVETALQPPHAASHALQQRSESLAVALTLHRIAAAQGPVSPARLSLLPAEHIAVAPLAVQVAAAERVLSLAVAAARSGSPLWPIPTTVAAGVQVLVLEDGVRGEAADSGGYVSGTTAVVRPATPMTPLNQLRVLLSGVSARLRLQQLQQVALLPTCAMALEPVGSGAVAMASNHEGSGANVPAAAVAAFTGSSVGAASPPAPELHIPRMASLQPRPSTASIIFGLAAVVPASSGRGSTPGNIHQQLRAVLGAAASTPAAASGGFAGTVLAAPWRGAFAWDSRPNTTTTSTSAAAAAFTSGGGSGGGGALRFAPAGPVDATLRLGSAAAWMEPSAAIGGVGGYTKAGTTSSPPNPPGLTALLSSAAAVPAPELTLLDLWATTMLTPLVESLRRMEGLIRAIRLGLEARLPQTEGVSSFASLCSVGGFAGSFVSVSVNAGPWPGKGAAAAVAAAATTVGTGNGAAAVVRGMPTLSTNLSAIFAELWLTEACALHGVVCGALGGAEELAMAATQPGHHDTPGVRHMLNYVISGFAPPGWKLPPQSHHLSGGCEGGGGEAHIVGNGAGGGRSSRGDGGPLIARPPGGRHPVHLITLEQWEYDLTLRVRHLQEVTSEEVDLRPAAVDMSCLARPAAFMVCLRRAFAYEQNTHPNNVTCRLSLQPPADGSGSVVMATSLDGGVMSSAPRPAARMSEKSPSPLAGIGAAGYPIAAPRSVAISGLMCRDLEVPFGLSGAGLVGLGLMLPGPAATAAARAAAAASAAGAILPGGLGGLSSSLDASLALPGIGLLLEAHSAAAMSFLGVANVHSGATAAVATGVAATSSAATAASSNLASMSSSAVLPDPSSYGQSATAAAVAASQSMQIQQAAITGAAAAAAATMMAALRPCPTLYAVPGYADPALRKALGARGAFRPPAGRNARASTSMMGGLPASTVPPPSVPVPLAATPQEALLCDDSYWVAWECRPNSVAADAPPERLPLLAVRRVGGGEGLGSDRGTVLRLGLGGDSGGGGRRVL